jgi:hypothetical protein
MLYESDQFDCLIDDPWVPARVGDAIAAVVADADVAFGLDTLWPANSWDEYHGGQPSKVLYAGAAGVIWALAALRRGGHAETSLDLAAAALRALELERALPDASDDEHYRPGSLLHGETGPLLVCFLLSSDAQLANELHELVHDNVANPTDDICWGAPGTLLVALAMHDRTGDVRWLEAARESALALRARRGDDGLWRQDDDYRGLGTLHGAAGNTLCLLGFERDDALARETSAVLARHAFRKDGLATGPALLVGNSHVRAMVGSVSSGAPAPQASSPVPGNISTRIFSSPAPSSSGRRAHTRTRRATASAMALRATASRSSRRLRAQATRSGFNAPAASQSTPSPRRSGLKRRPAGAATHSSTVTSARRSSPPPASTPTPSSRSSMSSSQRLTANRHKHGVLVRIRREKPRLASVPDPEG